MYSLYNNIENELKKKDMTFYKLAKLTGARESLFSELKSGRQKDITLYKAKLIAEALDISIDELVK